MVRVIERSIFILLQGMSSAQLFLPQKAQLVYSTVGNDAEIIDHRPNDDIEVCLNRIRIFAKAPRS